MDHMIIMNDNIKDAYNDYEQDRYFSDPGLSFDDPDDIWNID